jgi:hypothetical protein
MLLDIIQPIFSYQNKVDPILPESSLTLYIEIGQYHLAHFALSSSGDVFTNYSLYKTTDQLNADSVVEFLQDSTLFQKPYAKQVIVHHSSEVVLMPNDIYALAPEKIILDTVHGDKIEYKIFRDEIDQWNMVNVFEVDVKITETSSKLFSSVSHTHINSLAINAVDRNNAKAENGLINIIFYPSSIHLSVFMGNALKLSQTYFYETKDDISYYLLSVMDTYQLDNEKVSMRVSGFIQNDSIFMGAIKEHVLDAQFSIPAVHLNTLDDSKFPLHYFTPLFLTTQCV